MRDYWFGRVVEMQASAFASFRTRRRMLRMAGIRVPHDTVVCPGVYFGSDRVAFGSGAFVGIRCLFDGSDRIEIEDGVHLACDVRLITSTHDVGPASQRAGRRSTAPVVIGRGAWIGAGSIILPGVTVAPGCVVGAGSLVTKSTTPDTLWLGQPARCVRDLL